MVMNLWNCYRDASDVGSIWSPVGAAARRHSLRRASRVDGYDQAFVDSMRSASVTFGVALASAGNTCEYQPMACRMAQSSGQAHTRANDSRRR